MGWGVDNWRRISGVTGGPPGFRKAHCCKELISYQPSKRENHVELYSITPEIDWRDEGT
jgi:hypothetical protein